MNREEMLESKMHLFDVISKTKDSLNIPEIKNETELIFGFCMDLANMYEVDLYQKESLLTANLHDAVTSYLLRPDLDMEDRIPFINGIIYAAQSSIIYKESLKGLSLEQKENALFKFYSESVASIVRIDTNDDYFSYFKLGIKMELEMQERINAKKNNKKRD